MLTIVKINAEITKSVLREIVIESSSDLIVALYEIFKRTGEYPIESIDPIRGMEILNWCLGDDNVTYSAKFLDSLDYGDLVDANAAYMFVMGIFLEDDTVSKMFKLDDKDIIGWEIYKQLNAKREYTRRLIAILDNKL